MYSLFLGIQYIGLLILLVELTFVFSQKASRLQVTLILTLGGTLINFVGYLFELKASTRQEALTAVKFIYFGKPYIAFGTLLFVLEFWKIKVSPILIRALAVLHLTATFLVLTCGRQKLFYSSIDFVEDGFFPHLKFGHGPYYIMYSVLLVIYLLVMLTVSIGHLKRSESKIERKRALLLAAIAIVSLTGFLVFLTGKTKGYDSTVPAYVISTSLMMVLLVRCGILDTLSVAKDTLVENYGAGLIIMDQEGNLIYYNTEAGRLFPDIREISYRPALNEVKRLYETGSKLEKDGWIYEVTEKELKKNQDIYEKVYVINNITESYHYIKNLEKQKSIAEQANRAKSDFLARMSHEIRTPINAVMGMNEMILRESTEPEIREYAMNVRASAKSLLSIINDILDSSKIESGKMEILPAEYELDSMLNDLVNMIAIRAEEKGLLLEVMVDENLPNKLYGDDVRIKQILINLLTNAVKYTPEGTVRLLVGGTLQGSTVLMHYEVADTGIGIKKEDLSKLCEAFERIEEIRNRNIEGTGLGMTIVASLLEMMGSKIRVESVYGSGTTFSFDLVQEILNSEAIGDFQERVRKSSREYSYKELFKGG